MVFIQATCPVYSFDERDFSTILFELWPKLGTAYQTKLNVGLGLKLPIPWYASINRPHAISLNTATTTTQ